MGFATFKTCEFLVCEKGSLNTFHDASRSTLSPSSMLLGYIQELNDSSPESHKTAGEEGGSATGTVRQFLSHP